MSLKVLYTTFMEVLLNQVMCLPFHLSITKYDFIHCATRSRELSCCKITLSHLCSYSDRFPSDLLWINYFIPLCDQLLMILQVQLPSDMSFHSILRLQIISVRECLSSTSKSLFLKCLKQLYSTCGPSSLCEWPT